MVVKLSASDEHQTAPRPSPPPSPPAEIPWIQSLAGEWQSRWERLQYPQALSGASLLK
jgi:hypothetical protein